MLRFLSKLFPPINVCACVCACVCARVPTPACAHDTLEAVCVHVPTRADHKGEKCAGGSWAAVP